MAALAAPRQRKRRRVQPLVTQLLEESFSNIDEYESEEDDVVTGSIGADDPKYIFRDKTWT